MTPRLDQFTESLAVRIDVFEDLEAFFSPARESSREDVDVRVSQRLETFVCRRGSSAALVVNDHECLLPRETRRALDIDAVRRHLAREQRMSARESTLVAHVEKRELPASDEREAQVSCGDGRRHGALERSQRLGNAEFA